jgi:hypothetical protein
MDSDALKRLIAELQEAENELSYERRLLHGKIDMLRAERTSRLKQKPDDELAQLGDERLNEALGGKPAPSGREERVEDAFPDLATLSDSDLDDLIARLEAQENEISYRRRLLQGRLDILRAGAKGDDLGQLAEILSGGGGGGGGRGGGASSGKTSPPDEE